MRACRLFKTKKLCATASVVDKYIAKIGGTQNTDGLPETPVGDYAATNTDFTDVFTGLYDEGRMRIMPKSNTCTKAPAHRTLPSRLGHHRSTFSAAGSERRTCRRVAVAVEGG